MNFQDLGSLGEIIAAIATIATLVYLAIQIHQNTRVTRATSIREILFKFSEWQIANISNENMRSLYQKSFITPMPQFTDLEWNEMNGYCKSLFHILEAQFVHSRFSVGTGDNTEPHLRGAKTLIDSYPVWKKFWDEEASSGHWTEGFVEAVEKLDPGELTFVQSDGSANET